MATDREIGFLTQALHHLVSSDTFLFQAQKYLRAFIQEDSKYVDKQLSKLGYKVPDHETLKDISRIYGKLKRQWLDSRSASMHKEEGDCECHLCLLQKLREYAKSNIES